MKRIFIDTNVVMDFLTGRQPFFIDASTLFDLADKKMITMYVSAISYNNIHYTLRKLLGSNAVVKLLSELAEMTEIVDMTSAVIKQSLKTDFKDYEDAIQYYSALSIPNISFIVTRNVKDFKESSIPVLTPSEAVGFLSSNK